MLSIPHGDYMKSLLKITLAAAVGSAGGSAIRQLAKSRRTDSEEAGELVIAASPAAIVAGVIAGLLVGLMVKGRDRKAALIAAAIVGANVGANADPAVLSALGERLRSGGSTGP